MRRFDYINRLDWGRGVCYIVDRRIGHEASKAIAWTTSRDIAELFVNALNKREEEKCLSACQ